MHNNLSLIFAFSYTDIILPGTNTVTNSTPLIKAGEQVTFIKTQKGVYLRTTDGRILAVRGAQQPTSRAQTTTTSSSGLPLDQGIVSSLAGGSFPASTLTSQSEQGSSSGQRHQLADLLSEKVPTSAGPVNLSDDSDPDSDFFDPFKSPAKSNKGSQDSRRPDGSGPSGSPFLGGGSGSKPATCTVSPGVQSVPLASTLPLRPFGQSRQSGTPPSQPSSSPPSTNVTTSSASTGTASSDSTTTPTSLSNLIDSMPMDLSDSSDFNLASVIPSSSGLTNQLNSMALQRSSSNETSGASTTTAPATAPATATTANQTTSNPPATSNPNVPNTNTSMQQHMQPTASNYGMPYFPGMMPMPSTGNSQQQQPPIVINYQLPMPPGAMMQPGFMPFGFPPMMYPGGAPPPGQGGQYQPGGMFGGMGGQMPGQTHGQFPMGHGQEGRQGPSGQGQPTTTGQSTPGAITTAAEGTSQPSVSSADVVNQKMADAQQGSLTNTTTNA